MSHRARVASAVGLALVVAGAILTATSPAGAAKPPRLSLASTAVAEDGIAVVTMRLSRKAPKAVTVRGHTKNQPARAGSDYQQTAGTVKIAKGKRTATIRVPLLADQTPEPTEQFTIKVTAKRAKAPARPHVVTIQDDDAPRLAGQLTLEYTRDTGNPYGTNEFLAMTMDLHLVPTAAAGEWRDNGTGTWNSNVGTGNFLTSADPPDFDNCPGTEAGLVLGNYSPATSVGTPYLDASVVTCVLVDAYLQICGQGPPPPPGTCNGQPIWTPYPRFFDPPWPDGAPGASGSYTGSSLYTRGVAFDYDRTFPDPRGYGAPGVVTVKVTGHLDPVH